MSRIFPAHPEALRRALETVADDCRALGLAEAKIRRAELAIEELFTNTCTHGVAAAKALGLRSDLSVRISVASFEAGVEIAYADDGPPFDPGLSTQEVIETGPREPGGEGRRIVARMADAVRYQRDGRLNRLYLRFGIA